MTEIDPTHTPGPDHPQSSPSPETDPLAHTIATGSSTTTTTTAATNTVSTEPSLATTATFVKPRPTSQDLSTQPSTKSKTNNTYNLATYNTATSSSIPTEPTSFTIANKSSEWHQAIAEELFALHTNGTWSLVPPVKITNVVDCKWVYRLKTDPNGRICRYKTRGFAICLGSSLVSWVARKLRSVSR